MCNSSNLCCFVLFLPTHSIPLGGIHLDTGRSTFPFTTKTQPRRSESEKKVLLASCAKKILSSVSVENDVIRARARSKRSSCWAGLACTIEQYSTIAVATSPFRNSILAKLDTIWTDPSIYKHQQTTHHYFHSIHIPSSCPTKARNPPRPLRKL